MRSVTAPVLRAEDVRVRRGGEEILSGVSVQIPERQSVLIQGNSGSGKTTLFEVFGLLSEFSTGNLFIDQTDVSTLSRRERARFRRDKLGIVYQDFQLVPDLTARENARLPQQHRNDVDEAWLDTVFDQLAITPIAEQYPATLSGGERQRVAIARAVANKPGIILADEPTGQLDPATTEHVLSLLFDAQDLADTTLITVSHDPQITTHFKTVYRLENGHLHSEQSTNTNPGSE